MASLTNDKLANAFLFASPFIGILVAAAAIGVSMWVLTIPFDDRWDRATVVKVCRDGTKLFRMEDGEYRVRTPGQYRSFHAASADVCES